jgi:hypothetical protein
MSKKAQLPALSVPEWRDEWVPLADVIRHDSFQVRRRLDGGAVKRYADMTRAGSEPPPIKVGRVAGRLYLLDGWHRMEAGALETARGLNGEEVRVHVADMSRAQAAWVAAQANLGHGVQYRGRELHEVFKAFVKAKGHVRPDGSLMSYREIAPIIGKPHTTVRTWMIRYFPKVAAAMGGIEHGNKEAEPAPLGDLREEHKAAALEALREVTQRLDLVTPEARWELVRELEGAREAALRLGVKEPLPEDF